MSSNDEDKSVSERLSEETMHESKIALIAIFIQFLIIDKIGKKINWLANILTGLPSSIVEFFCTLIAAYILVLFETLILTRIKSNLFLISRRTSIVFTILIIIVGFIQTALAFQYKMSGSEIALQAGIMAISAGAVWMAPRIEEDKIFLRSVMVTLPAASLGIAVILVGSLVNPMPPQEPISPHLVPPNGEVEPHPRSQSEEHHDKIIYNQYNQSIFLGNANVSIPQNYYLSRIPGDPKSGDPKNIKDLIRFVSAARNSSGNFTMLKRVAFFEWYLKNRGFNVNFVYSKNFSNKSWKGEHVWLIYHNNPVEEWPIEPRNKESGNYLPISDEYKNYEREFKNIYELSNFSGGAKIYSWWNESNGPKLLTQT